MIVNIKKLNENAIIPTYSKVGDAGLDLTAMSTTFNDMYVEYGTGLAVEIPIGYVGYIFQRSSVSNYHLMLANAVGVVDSNYRGELKLRFKRTSKNSNEITYYTGDRVGQLIIMPIPAIEFNIVEELAETSRGQDGFGSTGA